MAHIKLNGKEYELQFKNRELRQLEERTGKSMESFFGEEMASGKIGPMYTLLLIMLKRHDDFKHVDEDDFMDVLDDEMEKDLTFEHLGEALQKAVEASVFMKQAQAKKAEKPKVVKRA